MPFLKGLLALYNLHRMDTSSIKIIKCLRVLQRTRAINFKIGHFQVNNSENAAKDSEHSEPNTCSYGNYLMFRLVMLFFMDAESQNVLQIPRLFWIPSDLTFSEVNPILMFFFQQLMRHSKLDRYEIIEKKIMSHDGEHNFNENSGYFLSDNFDEDNFIKIVFNLKKSG